MKQSIIAKIKFAPKEPGVYIFYFKQKTLYIGKATNLQNRLKSYLKITDLKTQSLNNEADKLKYIVLQSEIEALIEESRLIQALKPKYNILWMDNKSYHYVAFTKEKFPKIFITHKNLKNINSKLKIDLIGPFTDGAALKLVMKTIRRYFPYCTCPRTHFRDCLNAQIGRCLGNCCKKTDPSSTIASLPSIARNDRKAYTKNILAVKMILRGQSKKLLKTLTDIKEKNALNNILQHRPYITTDFITNDYAVSEKWLTAIVRVECYDISNLSGKEAVGVLTALIKSRRPNGIGTPTETSEENNIWLPDKNSYRKFKIQSTPTRDDPRMIQEILTRRINHPEWPYPDLIIIDGGITQYRAAHKVLIHAPHLTSRIPQLISFAKPQKLVYGLKPQDEPTPINQLPQEFQQLIEQAIYQTHNFAVRYHRQVRNIGFFQ